MQNFNTHDWLSCMSQGLDGMEYKEHLDYDIVVSTNPAFNKAVVRINVFKNHRQVNSTSLSQTSWNKCVSRSLQTLKATLIARCWTCQDMVVCLPVFPHSISTE